MIYKLELGDWSEDGHKISESFLFDCNYDIHKIRQAYKDSCKKLGVGFNCNEDYTGLGLGCRSERLIWTEYQESEISETAFEILNNFGCFKEVDFYKEDGVYYKCDKISREDVQNHFGLNTDLVGWEVLINKGNIQGTVCVVDTKNQIIYK